LDVGWLRKYAIHRGIEPARVELTLQSSSTDRTRISAQVGLLYLLQFHETKPLPPTAAVVAAAHAGNTAALSTNVDLETFVVSVLDRRYLSISRHGLCTMDLYEPDNDFSWQKRTIDPRELISYPLRAAIAHFGAEVAKYRDGASNGRDDQNPRTKAATPQL
jgi:hypothetical protein